MAQATKVGTSEDARLAYDNTDAGTTWVDMSGSTVSCSFDSWDRTTGQINTIDGDEAIAGFGKLTITGVNVTALYTDGETTDAFGAILGFHQTAGGGQCMLQYCPQGTGSTKFCIETNTDAKLDSMTMPDFDAGSGDTLTYSFHVATSGINYAAHG